MMRFIGEDLLGYLRSLRERLRFIEHHAEFWQIQGPNGPLEVLFLPRMDPMPGEPSHGLPRFITESGKTQSVVAMVYPDRRGAGYGLARYEDHPAFSFLQVSDCENAHFTHASGFQSKTSSAEPERLKELFQLGLDG